MSKLTKEQIKNSPEYQKCKKDMEAATENDGGYSYQVIAYGLKSLKDQFGQEAVEMMAEDVPDILEHVTINTTPTQK